MGNAFVRSFAFGMDEEIKNLGQLAMDPSNFSLQPQQPPPQQPPPVSNSPAALAQPAVSELRAPSVQDKWLKGMIARGIDPVFARGMMPNIGDESGWNTSVQEGKPLKGRGGRGAYQLTGDRREEFERRYGDDYSDENQMDFLAWEALEGPERANYDRVLKEAGNDERKAAAGIVKHFLRPAKEHMDSRAAKYLNGEGGSMSSRNSPYGGEAPDNSDLDELAKEYEKDPKVAKRQYWGAALKDLSTGIGAIGRGQSPDMGRFMEAYYARQEEAKQRLAELASERRRRGERVEGHNWDLDAEDRATERDVASEERADARQQASEARGETRQIGAEGRAEAGDVRKEDRTQARIDKENEALSTSIGLLYPNSPSLKAAQEVAKINPDAGMRYMEQKHAEEVAQQKIDTDNENNAAIGKVYGDKGFDDIAQIASRGDLVTARELYKDRTGITDAQLDAKILQQGGPQAVALAERLRLESGSTDPQFTGAIDLEKKYLSDEGELVLSNREKQGQLEAMTAALSGIDDGDTGAFQAAMLPFNQFLSSFGLGDIGKTDRQTVINAIGNNLISYMRKPGEGVVSDADADRFAAAAPGLGKSPISNKVLTYVHLNTLQRQNIAHDARMEYFAKGGDLSDTKARDAYIHKAVTEQFGEGDMLPEVKNAQDAVHVDKGKPYIYKGKFYINTDEGVQG